MRIIIDSNKIIAALIKDHTIRDIIFDEKFEFFAPSFIKSEITKYKKDITEKANLNEAELSILIEIIFSKICIIPYDKYSIFLPYFLDAIIDEKDIPYLAACKSCSTEGIWTHDPHFKKQKNIKIFTNIDMINISNSI